jgi:hypothetical protein
MQQTPPAGTEGAWTRWRQTLMQQPPWTIRAVTRGSRVLHVACWRILRQQPHALNSAGRQGEWCPPVAPIVELQIIARLPLYTMDLPACTEVARSRFRRTMMRWHSTMTGAAWPAVAGEHRLHHSSWDALRPRHQIMTQLLKWIAGLARLSCRGAWTAMTPAL